MFSVALLLAACCEKSELSPDPTPGHTEAEKIPIKISTTITKVNETGFEQGDQVGIYVVNEPNTLQPSGNHANNVLFKYINGSWVSESPLYWKDQTTKADFYCYYPYDSSISSIDAYPFSIKADQSSDNNYKSNDFLWGKTGYVSPTTQAVGITVKHILSNVIIKLVAGNGYTDEDMNSAEVTICGMQTNSTINLANGTITANGNIQDITPKMGVNARQALVIPQSVTNTDIIKITVGDKTYVLNQSINLVSGKQYTCTVTINKTSQGINIGIGGWNVDDNDFGGIVE